MTTARGVQAFVLALLAGPPLAGAAITVEHAPVACVPADRYARITARGVPAAEVARAELQFRGGAAGPWYAVAMTRQADSSWGAYVPRPSAALQRIEYRVVMTGNDAASAESGPHDVRVTGPAEECASVAPSSVDAPIVVAVPAGAPLVPPVPAGFSPAGVVAAKGPAGRHTGLKIAGAAAALAVGAAVATGTAASSAATPTSRPVVPELRFNGTMPIPGSVINPNADRALVILLQMVEEPAVPLNLVWQSDLSNAEGTVCLYMLGVMSAVQRPLGLALTGPLISTGQCPRQVDIQRIRTRVTHQDVLIYDQALDLPFHVRP